MFLTPLQICLDSAKQPSLALGKHLSRRLANQQPLPLACQGRWCHPVELFPATSATGTSPGSLGERLLCNQLSTHLVEQSQGFPSRPSLPEPPLGKLTCGRQGHLTFTLETHLFTDSPDAYLLFWGRVLTREDGGVSLTQLVPSWKSCSLQPPLY